MKQNALINNIVKIETKEKELKELQKSIEE